MARIPKLPITFTCDVHLRRSPATLTCDCYMAAQRLVSSERGPCVAASRAALLARTGRAGAGLLEAPGLQDLTLMMLASDAGHLERELSGRRERVELRASDAWFVPLMPRPMPVAPVPVSWRWRSIRDEPLLPFICTSSAD